LMKKKYLIGCIFMTLLFQFIVTALTVKLDQTHHYLGKDNALLKTIPLVLVSIVMIVVMLSYKLPFIVNQLIFVSFSVLTGLILSQFTYYINDPDIVHSALLATIINSVALLMLGLIIVYFKYDLEWMGSLLFSAILLLITYQTIVSSSKKSTELNKKISTVAVVLFSLYILYDTNNILLKYKNNNKVDCIRGSFYYYLDVINLFTSYLDIKS
jgi:modulator of FtsH protease